MKDIDFRTWGPATLLVVLVAIIIVAIGGILVIVHPETLSFEQYIDALEKLAIAAGALGIGRGILKAGENDASFSADLDDNNGAFDQPVVGKNVGFAEGGSVIGREDGPITKVGEGQPFGFGRDVMTTTVNVDGRQVARAVAKINADRIARR